MSTDEAEAWRKRFDRERAARREAEALLHERSRELYELNQSLEARAAELSASLDQLRATQTLLVEREKMAALGGLVAGVAHEINTPLGVSLTATTFGAERVAQLARAAESGQLTRGQLRTLLEELRESLHLVQTNLERGASLVRSFKMVAVDQTSEHMRVVQPQELGRDVVASVRPLLRQASAEASVSGSASSPIHLEAGALVQILTNLLQNACVHGFTDGGPPAGERRIEIRFDEKPGALELSVRDNGVGMPPEVAQRVFEPFYTTRGNAGGTGLGMHIVYNLVAIRFLGHIALDSAPGRGARWTLHLPFDTPALQRVGSTHDALR